MRPLRRNGALAPTLRFQLHSIAPITAGEEVTIAYGERKPNKELMRDYGASRWTACGLGIRQPAWPLALRGPPAVESLVCVHMLA